MLCPCSARAAVLEQRPLLTWAPPGCACRPRRLRDHSNNAHTSRLEWVVIWLIVIEVIVGLFECASILGWVGGH